MYNKKRDAEQFICCPHCGIPATDERIILSFTGDYYICTNHKSRGGSRRGKIIPCDQMRPKYEHILINRKPLPVDEDFVEKANALTPREFQVSWEITRKARWERYLERPRTINNKIVSHRQKATFAELLMVVDKQCDRAKLAIITDENYNYKREKGIMREDNRKIAQFSGIYESEIGDDTLPLKKKG